MSRLQFWFFASLGFVVLFGLSGCGSSDADDPPQRGPGGPGGRGGGGFNLYSNETVAKELALTEDQKASFKKISDDFRSSMQDMQDLDPQERRTKMQDIRKEMDDKNAAVLDDKQKNRMKEIRLQMQGTGALSTKEVADSLKLTDDQKKQIADLTKDLDEDRRVAFQDGGFNDPDVRDKLAKITKETDTKILALLTKDQTASFDKMKGAKVEKLPQGGFGGGGFGGGGFGGGFGGPGGGRGGRGGGGGGPGGGAPGGGGPGGGGSGGGGAPPAGGRAQ